MILRQVRRLGQIKIPQRLAKPGLAKEKPVPSGVEGRADGPEAVPAQTEAQVSASTAAPAPAPVAEPATPKKSAFARAKERSRSARGLASR